MKLVMAWASETFGSAAYRMRFPLKATTAGRSVGMRPNAEATDLEIVGHWDPGNAQRNRGQATPKRYSAHLYLAPLIQQNVNGWPSFSVAIAASACPERLEMCVIGMISDYYSIDRR